MSLSLVSYQLDILRQTTTGSTILELALILWWGMSAKIKIARVRPIFHFAIYVWASPPKSIWRRGLTSQQKRKKLAAASLSFQELSIT